MIPAHRRRVNVVREANQELVDTFSRVLPQLSSTAQPLDHPLPSGLGPASKMWSFTVRREVRESLVPSLGRP